MSFNIVEHVLIKCGATYNNASILLDQIFTTHVLLLHRIDVSPAVVRHDVWSYNTDFALYQYGGGIGKESEPTFEQFLLLLQCHTVDMLLCWRIKRCSQ